MTNIRVLWKVIFAQLNLCDFKKKKAAEIKVHNKSS